jgi:hypothetical protein
MATPFSALLAEARKLPRKQRARLARELYLSFVYHLEEIEGFTRPAKAFRRGRAHRRGIRRRLNQGDDSRRRRSDPPLKRSGQKQSG